MHGRRGASRALRRNRGRVCRLATFPAPAMCPSPKCCLRTAGAERADRICCQVHSSCTWDDRRDEHHDNALCGSFDLMAMRARMSVALMTPCLDDRDQHCFVFCYLAGTCRRSSCSRCFRMRAWTWASRWSHRAAPASRPACWRWPWSSCRSRRRRWRCTTAAGRSGALARSCPRPLARHDGQTRKFCQFVPLGNTPPSWCLFLEVKRDFACCPESVWNQYGCCKGQAPVGPQYADIIGGRPSIAVVSTCGDWNDL